MCKNPPSEIVGLGLPGPIRKTVINCQPFNADNGKCYRSVYKTTLISRGCKPCSLEYTLLINIPKSCRIGSERGRMDFEGTQTSQKWHLGCDIFLSLGLHPVIYCLPLALQKNTRHVSSQVG
ncbi:hypothetical protein XELAEV_18003004mg [Xenopus laevis]|nr:hypothetical protein XELAEV_18003004mg [Xenopus laevis]